MKKSVKLFVLISSIGLFSTGCSRSPEKFADKITNKIANKLDLNDAQKDKLNKIKEPMLAEYKQRSNKRDEHKEVFRKMALSERLDKAEIKALMNKKRDKFEAKFDKYFPLIEDFHASLNPEQQETLVKLAEKMHKKRRSRWH